MRLRLHILFWLGYLIIESFIVYSGHEWGIQSFLTSLVYHASLLIPRLIITYVFIGFILPLSFKRPFIKLGKIFIYTLYLILGLLFYRAFLNWVSWPLVMDQHPNFNPFDLRLSAYSFLKMATPLSLLVGLLAIRKEWASQVKIERLQKENTFSELKYLKAQVNPHFLFNTLNSLYVLALDDAKETAPAIAKLSSLFRYIMDSSAKEWVKLESEISIVKEYIFLESLRYGERVDIHLDIQKGLRNVKIPPLILLPFIENMFKHGVSESIGQCAMVIRIGQKEKMTVLECQNTFEQNEATQDSRSGQGIDNVLKRLSLVYEQYFEYNAGMDDDVYKVYLALPFLANETK